MVRKSVLFIALVVIALATAGCGDFWQAQGDASRANAQAALRRAEAERQNAQAAIIDAQARGALADSQADALRSSIDSLVDLADDGEYVWLFAGLAFAILAFAGWAIWATHRRPAAPPPEAPRQIVMLETPAGPVRMIREARETPEQFALRVALLAAQLSTQERTLIEAPRR